MRSLLTGVGSLLCSVVLSDAVQALARKQVLYYPTIKYAADCLWLGIGVREEASQSVLHSGLVVKKTVPRILT